MIQFILAIKSIFENDVPLLSKSRRKNFVGGAKARLQDYQPARNKITKLREKRLREGQVGLFLCGNICQYSHLT